METHDKEGKEVNEEEEEEASNAFVGVDFWGVVGEELDASDGRFSDDGDEFAGDEDL